MMAARKYKDPFGRLWYNVKKSADYGPKGFAGQKILKPNYEPKRVDFDADDLRDVLKDEGGAAGLGPLVKAVKADEEEVKRALKMMPDVGKHKEGDYILDDGKQVDIKESVLITLA